MPDSLITNLTEETGPVDGTEFPVYSGSVANANDRTRKSTFLRMWDYLKDNKITQSWLKTRIGDASETTNGLVERATDSEVETGTDTTRYVTPAQLRTYGAAAFMTVSFTGDVALPLPQSFVNKPVVIAAAVIRTFDDNDHIDCDLDAEWTINSAGDASAVIEFRLFDVDDGEVSDGSTTTEYDSENDLSTAVRFNSPGEGPYLVVCLGRSTGNRSITLTSGDLSLSLA